MLDLVPLLFRIGESRWIRLHRALILANVFISLLPNEVSPFAFLPTHHSQNQHVRSSRAFPLSISSSSSWDEKYRELQSIQERQTQSALLDALFVDDGAASSLLTIHLVGQARLQVSRNSNRTNDTFEQIVLVLTAQEKQEADTTASSLLLPLASMNQLKLLSFAAAKRSLSKSVLLGLNTLLVNRDGALFDNLPWSEWSVDPQQRNRDAAGNAIIQKFHLGKRDAYNRFMGKDWQGRSLAIGNMALRLKYMLEEENSLNKATTNEEGESRKSLAIRVLQLQIRELQMELADIQSQLAVARNNNGENLAQLEKDQAKIKKQIEDNDADLFEVSRNPDSIVSRVSSILERVADWTTADGDNAAPYRGAMGYAPMLDSKDDIDESRLPYTSPFDLLKDILEDQLNAKVIGCVLENTSLLRGNLALGGAIVLQRLAPSRTAKLAGEEVEFEDYDEDFGNEGVKGGEIMIVECDGDEAIGLSLTYGVPLKVESEIFDLASVLAEPQELETEMSKNVIEILPIWKPVDSEMRLQVEGDNEGETKAAPISIPRTSTSLFDGIFEEKPSGSPLFPTDTPIKSLGELDQLSNEDKAKTLLEMSNFSERLPRPRIVKNSETNPLDELMLPLIDESVRRQYYIRDAERRGDLELEAQLKASKSRAQIAKEKAEVARNDGKDDVADRWETEAKFLETLRAHVTQDEGSYSQFLDRDDWYEGNRQRTAERAKKSSFGTLLDGIE
jgi:hypothetical protein